MDTKLASPTRQMDGVNRVPIKQNVFDLLSVFCNLPVKDNERHTPLEN